jgi:hypothetical protein
MTQVGSFIKGTGDSYLFRYTNSKVFNKLKCCDSVNEVNYSDCYD